MQSVGQLSNLTIFIVLRDPSGQGEICQRILSNVFVHGPVEALMCFYEGPSQTMWNEIAWFASVSGPVEPPTRFYGEHSRTYGNHAVSGPIETLMCFYEDPSVTTVTHTKDTEVIFEFLQQHVVALHGDKDHKKMKKV